MTEPRNRSRKVTRKAGPPTETETASNEAASPVFQAPVSAEPQNQQESSSHEGAESKRRSSESSQDGEHGGNRKSRSRGGRGRGRGGNANSHNFQQGGGNSNRNNNRGNNNGNNRGRRNVPKSMQGADLTKRLPEPPKQPNDALRIYALGGISEIGRNMTVFEYGDDLLIIDCGVLFPSSGEPGVDLILPDFGPIEKKLDKIKALVVTHAHEDHIGAIPWLLKLRPDIPVVASRFTIALIAAKCKEHRQKPKFVEVNEKSDVTYGPFRVRFWAVNHSIPDALGIMLGTLPATSSTRAISSWIRPRWITVLRIFPRCLAMAMRAWISCFVIRPTPISPASRLRKLIFPPPSSAWWLARSSELLSRPLLLTSTASRLRLMQLWPTAARLLSMVAR